MAASPEFGIPLDQHREAARETQRGAEESKIQLVNDPALKAAIGKELVARQEGFVEAILELCQRSEPEYLATADLGPNSPTILLRPSRTFGRRLFADSPRTVKAARPCRVRSRPGSAPTASDQSTSAVWDRSLPPGSIGETRDAARRMLRQSAARARWLDRPARSRAASTVRRSAVPVANRRTHRRRPRCHRLLAEH